MKFKLPSIHIDQRITISILTLIVISVIFEITRQFKERFVDGPEFTMQTVRSSSAPYNANDPQLFTFANNKCSPHCCGTGTELSCSGGCVCKTKEQNEMMMTRGYNRSTPSDI